MSRITRSAYGLSARKADEEEPWFDRAACKQGGCLGDPEAWFLESNLPYLRATKNRAALAICQTACPVLAECEEDTAILRSRGRLVHEIRGGKWFDLYGKAHAVPGSKKHPAPGVL